MIDTKTWENIKRMAVEIATYQDYGIEFDVFKAAALGYSEIEQSLAVQILEKQQPTPERTRLKIMSMLHMAPSIPKLLYLPEVQLVFLIWHEHKFFTVIDEWSI